MQNVTIKQLRLLRAAAHGGSLAAAAEECHVFVDLPKDRRLMPDCTVVPRPQSGWRALNLVGKS
jgi:hypothetical protein